MFVCLSLCYVVQKVTDVFDDENSCYGTFPQSSGLDCSPAFIVYFGVASRCGRHGHDFIRAALLLHAPVYPGYTVLIKQQGTVAGLSGQHEHASGGRLPLVPPDRRFLHGNRVLKTMVGRDWTSHVSFWFLRPVNA